MSGEDLLGSNLNGARTDDSVVNNSLSHGWSGVDGLVNLSQRGSDVSILTIAEGSRGKDARGSAMAEADESGENLRKNVKYYVLHSLKVFTNNEKSG